MGTQETTTRHAAYRLSPIDWHPGSPGNGDIKGRLRARPTNSQKIDRVDRSIGDLFTKGLLLLSTAYRLAISIDPIDSIDFQRPLTGASVSLPCLSTLSTLTISSDPSRAYRLSLFLSIGPLHSHHYP
jgi:hypothetical protein